ncbi:restriction endonuclease [Arcobacter sp. CECT 8983]|uniref:McrC family protein n=1 Tax=Arcobacter sp. CECT 8983 TaxID=2044508 RepID=UPI00100B0750|nr:McrC family protein [Arcobacter sp. CECT 8983]RXJ91684.1 restriction endonuclease [Arcobacter sp. CECT 8983]
MKYPKKVCEFGYIRNIKAYPNATDTFNEIFLNDDAFEELISFIETNSALNGDIDKAFSIYRKSGKQYIQVKNYVGIIETKNKTVIEILPKIYLSNDKDEIKKTKDIFLKMLKELKNSPFISISDADLQTKKDFPMLEIFISSFLIECERLIKYLKLNYIKKSENLKFIKGKIEITNQIKHNSINKSNFFVNYDKYDLNIPQNKLIVSTLYKIINISISHKNISKASKLLKNLPSIETSKNITRDFQLSLNSNRLFKSYEKALNWAEVFLLNKSFTNFSGDSINQAILYPMERIFEDYICSLLKKFTIGNTIKLQDKSYYLVDKHKNKGKFLLKPDAILSKKESLIIFDTKWKLLNSKSNSKNYNIKSADMYQLYAYGKKYSLNSQIEPKLKLIYPKNINFIDKLDNFIYDGDLVLEVIPFDLERNEKEQILSLIH